MHPDNTLIRPRCAIRRETVYGQVADTRREWLLPPHAQYELEGRSTSVLADGVSFESDVARILSTNITTFLFHLYACKSFPSRILVLYSLVTNENQKAKASSLIADPSSMSWRSGGRFLRPSPSGPQCLHCSCLANCCPHVCSGQAQPR